MLEKEFKYYIDHQGDLLKKYNGKFLVIKGEKVIGDYSSHSEAYNHASQTEKLGTFLIQHCIPGSEGFSQTFNSQVIFHASV
jgi:hypothetical protein